MRKALCIGGPFDGQQVQVQGVELHYPVLRDRSVYVPATEDCPEYWDNFKIGRYQLERDGLGAYTYRHLS